MQITISRNILAGALSELAPLASKKTALMILSNVKFVTKGNKIRLQTSDAETSIRKYVDAENIDQDGSFLVDCASLTTFVNKVKGDNLTLTLDENTLTVKHDKGKAEFQTLSADDFPEAKTDGEATEVIIPASALENFVAVASNFVSDDDYRPQMKPIRAIVKGGTLTVCATDTRVLFKDAVTLADCAQEVEWFIEQSAFSSLLKSCKGQENVIVQVSPQNVSYRIGATTIFTQQTEGKFPDFNRVIPASHLIEVTFNKSEAGEAVQRAMLFTEESRLAKIVVSPLTMEVNAQNLAKISKAIETLACKSNAAITFGVNATKFVDCIKACGASDVRMELSDASRPIVFKDGNNPNRVILCMPMTLVNPQ